MYKRQADIVLDVKARRIRESGTEVAGRASDFDVYPISETNAQMVTGIGIDEFYIFSLGTVLSDLLIGFANGYFG